MTAMVMMMTMTMMVMMLTLSGSQTLRNNSKITLIPRAVNALRV